MRHGRTINHMVEYSPLHVIHEMDTSKPIMEELYEDTLRNIQIQGSFISQSQSIVQPEGLNGGEDAESDDSVNLLDVSQVQKSPDLSKTATNSMFVMKTNLKLDVNDIFQKE